MPANAYTDEIVTKHYQTNLKVEPADPRFKKYVRQTDTDGAGHFAFHHVSPGVYYVSCDLAWNAPSTYTDSSGAIFATSETVTHWIYKKIVVGDGQTVRVESWDNNFSAERVRMKVNIKYRGKDSPQTAWKMTGSEKTDTATNL